MDHYWHTEWQEAGNHPKSKVMICSWVWTKSSKEHWDTNLALTLASVTDSVQQICSLGVMPVKCLPYLCLYISIAKVLWSTLTNDRWRLISTAGDRRWKREINKKKQPKTWMNSSQKSRELEFRQSYWTPLKVRVRLYVYHIGKVNICQEGTLWTWQSGNRNLICLNFTASHMSSNMQLRCRM